MHEALNEHFIYSSLFGLGHFDKHHTLFDLWKIRFVGQKCTLLLIEDHTFKAQFKVASIMV